ncbi:unnamed protein product [[Candida] boidinii]|nr:unnamed protein product [[Candida] boidinii]
MIENLKIRKDKYNLSLWHRKVKLIQYDTDIALQQGAKRANKANKANKELANKELANKERDNKELANKERDNKERDKLMGWLAVWLSGYLEADREQRHDHPGCRCGMSRWSGAGADGLAEWAKWFVAEVCGCGRWQVAETAAETAAGDGGRGRRQGTGIRC